MFHRVGLCVVLGRKMFHRAAWSVVLGCCFFRARDGAGLVREKNRPAWLVGDKSGTKLSQQEENVPNRAILGEQGEFCTGTGGVRGLLAPETVWCPVWRSRVLEGPTAS